MGKNTEKNTVDKIEKIHGIYALFSSKLNKLRQIKNNLVQNISQRLSNKKAEDILKELKDKY